jgi:hypothetical protein
MEYQREDWPSQFEEAGDAYRDNFNAVEAESHRYDAQNE